MMLRPYFLSLTARAHVAVGDFSSARAVLDEAVRVVAKTSERWYEAEIHRQLGAVERAWSGSAELSEAQFALAAEVARTRAHKMWELRAIMSRARLQAESSDPRRAYDLLAPVYDWFTEGFDTADLREAKALLNELQ
jgi:predicted ATPase